MIARRATNWRDECGDRHGIHGCTAERGHEGKHVRHAGADAWIVWGGQK